MTNVDDVVIKLRDVIDDNVQDPITQRRRDGKNWVYEDFPREDSTLPRIGLAPVDVQYTSLALGTAKRVKNATIQVSVLVNEEGNKFDVDEDGSVENEESVRSYLSEKVEEAIIDNQSSIRDELNVRYVLPINSTTIRPSGKNIIKANLDFEVEYTN